MTAQKKYSEEFKADAVAKFKHAKETGKFITELAQELGVGDALLHAWAAAADKRARSKPKGKRAKQKPKAETRTQYPIALKQQAVAMVRSGMKFADVGRELKVGPSQVAYWVNRGISRGLKEGEPSELPVPVVAKPVNGIGAGGAITDALIYLRHAEREILEMIREGKISRPDQAHLLTLLALGALQKAIAK